MVKNIVLAVGLAMGFLFVSANASAECVGLGRSSGERSSIDKGCYSLSQEKCEDKSDNLSCKWLEEYMEPVSEDDEEASQESEEGECVSYHRVNPSKVKCSDIQEKTKCTAARTCRWLIKSDESAQTNSGTSDPCGKKGDSVEKCPNFKKR